MPAARFLDTTALPLHEPIDRVEKPAAKAKKRTRRRFDAKE
jgi:hypothetical protein